MLHWLRRQFEPRSTDSADARREYFLLTSLALLCMVTLLSLVMFTVLWLTDRSTGGLIGLYILALVIYALLWSMARRGAARGAANVLVLWFVLLCSVVFLGDIGNDFGIVALAVLFPVLLISPRTGILVTLVLVGMFIGEKFIAAGSEVIFIAEPPIYSPLTRAFLQSYSFSLQLLLVLGVAAVPIQRLLTSVDRESSAARDAQSRAETALQAQSGGVC